MTGLMFGLAILQANIPCAVSVCNSSLFSLLKLKMYDFNSIWHLIEWCCYFFLWDTRMEMVQPWSSHSL